jgi:hypothetical protein
MNRLWQISLTDSAEPAHAAEPPQLAHPALPTLLPPEARTTAH